MQQTKIAIDRSVSYRAFQSVRQLNKSHVKSKRRLLFYVEALMNEKIQKMLITRKQ